ncbi:MAG: YrdB family protein [Lewinellaceae bacterium]|nr:YrdB family protein [Lewinellaceae bacterium]
MHNHPLNLALRFGLEITALVALGYWTWHKVDSPWRWVATIGIPLIYAALWGVFRVNNDPGPAPVAVPGMVRLALEVLVFGSALLAWYQAGANRAFWIMLILLIGHYLVSYERVRWLWEQ